MSIGLGWNVFGFVARANDDNERITAIDSRQVVLEKAVTDIAEVLKNQQVQEDQEAAVERAEFELIVRLCAEGKLDVTACPAVVFTMPAVSANP